MNTSQIINKLKSSGFNELDRGIAPVSVFCKRNIDSTNVIDAVIVLDNNHVHSYGTNQTSGYNLDHIAAIDNQLISYFFLHGCFIINTLYLVVTDNVNESRNLCFQDRHKVWLYDSICKRLIIYENQPTDFAGIANLLEEQEDNNIPHFKNPNQFLSSAKLILADFIKNPTWLYAFLNILAFILLEFFGSSYDTDFMYRVGALNYDAVVNKSEYYRLITSMFMHFGFEHLLSNMVTLFLLGKELEKKLNFLTYSVIYLGSGLVAGLTSIFLNNNTSSDFIISAGASGAIMGIAGALIIILITSKTAINRSRGLRFMFIILLICYSTFSDSSIDNFAHIGGLIAGAIITFLIHKFSIRVKILSVE